VRIGKRSFGNGLLAVCPAADGVAAAVVRREHGVPPSLDLCQFFPTPDHTDARQAAVNRMVKDGGFNRIACTSALDLNAYSLMLVEAPDVPKAELAGAMRWRVKDLLDFSVDEAVIDFFEVPAQKGSDRSRQVFVVAARASVIKQRADLLLDAGLKLTAIDIPELCLRNVTALLPEDVGGVAFVYLARNQGLITLTRQATLYFSRRLQAGTEILWQQQADTVTPEIEGWLDSVVIEVQRSLDYYESHFTVPPIAGLVLGPLGRPVAGVAEYLKSQLGLPCRVLDLNELIDVRGKLSPEMQVRCLPAIAAALRTEVRPA